MLRAIITIFVLSPIFVSCNMYKRLDNSKIVPLYRNDKSYTGIMKNVFSVKFQKNSSFISGHEVNRIHRYVPYLKSLPVKSYIIVTGIGDIQDKRKSQNDKIGLARAKSVRDFLINHGISPHLITVRSMLAAKSRTPVYRKSNPLANVQVVNAITRVGMSRSIKSLPDF